MNYQKTLLRLLRQAKGKVEDDWLTQAQVVAAQAGHYCQCAYYARAFPKDYNAHKADARRAVGDLIIQCQICCELLGLDFDEVTQDAFIAFRDKMKEVAKHRRP